MPKFQPGQSGNPGGRPPGYDKMAAQARLAAPDALFALVRLCHDTEASPTLQYKAALTLLRYGFGRPPTAQEGRHEGGRGRFPNLRPDILALLEHHEWHYGRSAEADVGKLPYPRP